MENEDGIEEDAGHPPFEITDNLVILLLIVFTITIGIWWFLNLYMGRWIH
jgi:hypothetical protein